MTSVPVLSHNTMYREIAQPYMIRFPEIHKLNPVHLTRFIHNITFNITSYSYNVITKYVAPEPEGSSPHSQNPANGPYPEPGESTPHPPPPSQSP
jgi:hypothetical protein